MSSSDVIDFNIRSVLLPLSAINVILRLACTMASVIIAIIVVITVAVTVIDVLVVFLVGCLVLL